MGMVHWVAAIVGIFVVTLVFLPMYPAFDILKSNLSVGLVPEAQQAMGVIEMAFFLVPVIFIIGLILYAIASTERREYQSTRDAPEF
jgi:hypothetical protein